MRSDADPRSFPKCVNHLLAPPSKPFPRERWPSGHAMLSPWRKKGKEKVPVLNAEWSPATRKHERIKVQCHFHASQTEKS